MLIRPLNQNLSVGRLPLQTGQSQGSLQQEAGRSAPLTRAGLPTALSSRCLCSEAQTSAAHVLGPASWPSRLERHPLHQKVSGPMYQSRRTPGLWARSLVGACRRQPTDVSSHIDETVRQINKTHPGVRIFKKFQVSSAPRRCLAGQLPQQLVPHGRHGLWAPCEHEACLAHPTASTVPGRHPGLRQVFPAKCSAGQTCWKCLCSCHHSSTCLMCQH